MRRLLGSLFFLLLTAAPLLAQGGPKVAGAKPAVSGVPKDLNFMEIIHAGGIMVYALIGLSVVALTVMLFYVLSIRQGTVVSDRFMDEAETLIRKGDYLGLLQVCNRRNEAIARITQKTLDFATKNPSASFDDVREVTQAEGTRQASLLYQRVAYLSDIGTIAPMIGLLGTVMGMIKEFSRIANTAGSAQMEFAGGVSEALINTAGGLLIAIPALVVYSFFRGRVQRLIAELEAASTHLMALLSAQYKRATSRAGAAVKAPAPAAEPARRTRE